MELNMELKSEPQLIIKICQECKENQISRFCAEDKKALCNKCMLKNHKKHISFDPSQIIRCCKCGNNLVDVTCKTHDKFLCFRCFFDYHALCESEEFQMQKLNILEEYYQNLLVNEILKEKNQNQDQIRDEIYSLKSQVDESEKITKTIDSYFSLTISNYVQKILIPQFKEDSMKVDPQPWIKNFAEEFRSLQNFLAGNFSSIKEQLIHFNNQLGEKMVLLNSIVQSQKAKSKQCKYIIPQTSHQSDFTLIYSVERNKLFAFGQNDNGELGIPEITNKNMPCNISNFIYHEKVMQIATGGNHSVVLTTNNIYAFGLNDCGQLGDGSNITKFIPTKISNKFSNEKCLLVSCGNQFTIVSTDKNIYAFGANKSGQIGNGNTEAQLNPVNISNKFDGSKIVAVQCGGEFSMVQTEKDLYSFGFNENGELGDSTKTSRPLPKQITSLFNQEKILSAKCGSNHTLVLTKQGLWSFGMNTNGQLGDGTLESRSTPVSISQAFNGEEMLDIACGSYFSYVRTAKGIYYFHQDNQEAEGPKEQDKLPFTKIYCEQINLSEEIQILCGQSHTIITSGNDVYSMGGNDCGQLGDGTNDVPEEMISICDNFL